MKVLSILNNKVVRPGLKSVERQSRRAQKYVENAGRKANESTYNIYATSLTLSNKFKKPDYSAPPGEYAKKQAGNILAFWGNRLKTGGCTALASLAKRVRKGVKLLSMSNVAKGKAS